jgi:hypothetical protein
MVDEKEPPPFWCAECMTTHAGSCSCAKDVPPGMEVGGCPHCDETEPVKVLFQSAQQSEALGIIADCYQVVCDFRVGGCGSCGGCRKTIEEAINLWNSRHG